MDERLKDHDQSENRLEERLDKLSDRTVIIETTVARVDVSLNNHIKHHETILSHVLYPIMVGIALLIVGQLLKIFGVLV
jgi:hypothetical protein